MTEQSYDSEYVYNFRANAILQLLRYSSPVSQLSSKIPRQASKNTEEVEGSNEQQKVPPIHVAEAEGSTKVEKAESPTKKADEPTFHTAEGPLEGEKARKDVESPEKFQAAELETKVPSNTGKKQAETFPHDA